MKLFITVVIFCGVISAEVSAATLELELRIRDHLFFPATLEIPANQKVKIRVINEDPTPEEFESFELNREKVIVGNSQTVIFIGPLAPGIYPFFGEFYPKTAQGVVVVTE
ncbi:MAG: cupredoxin domain-containing protein [Gammaproteobacteria bacterium]|nr:cupredoxin domain-containing protein [Gammaproteobacteria bacterium]